MAGNGKTKRKSAGVKSKLISKTPLVIRFSKEESDKLKELPLKALEHFKNNQGNLSHWKAIIFRLNVTLILTDKHFQEKEAVSRLKMSVEILLIIFHTNKGKEHWSMSEQEISILEEALELSNGVQDLCTRKEMLLAYKETDKFLKQHYGSK